VNSITGPIIDWATHLIGNWGLWGVFFLMVLESACIPIPSEAIMPFAGFAVAQGKMSLLAAVAVGVAGNVVGSWISYAVGLYGGRPFVEHYGKYVLLSTHKLDTAEHWFNRYGAPAIFFSRMLPIVRTFISLPAGAARMPIVKFSIYTVVGCVPWVLMLGYIGEKIGQNWKHIERYMHYVDYVVLLAILVLIVWLVVRWRRRRGSGDPAVPQSAQGGGDQDPS
jgi:membrane protein DedA with SNARE-associated domain